MNIGILGGTFNPPHMGHLIVAEYVREELSLDKVLFVPSAISPHKQHLEIVDAHHRVAMLECAIEGNSYFAISEIETRRGGISFTIDTLKALREKYTGDKLFLLIGMDNLVEFHSWRMPDRILEMATLVVMTRPEVGGINPEILLDGRARVCAVPEIAISSSEIRTRVKEGRSIRYMVPPPLEAYIISNNLYR